MNKIYFLLIPVLFISSCAPIIQYVGETRNPTNKVDVYVTQESIKRSFEFIGKGYVGFGPGVNNAEYIQEQAIAKARQKGADAILITDQYFCTESGVIQSDTTLKTRYSQTQSSPTLRFNIYFIKYRD